VLVLNDDFRRRKLRGLLKGIARRNVTSLQSTGCVQTSGLRTFLHITYFSPSSGVNGLVLPFSFTSTTQLFI